MRMATTQSVRMTCLPTCFTGKERDAETGLDYFGARYFSGAMGRFVSPDAPFADQHIGDPQSWNLYSYVRNRPLNFVDHDGNAAAWALDSLREGRQMWTAPGPLYLKAFGAAAIVAGTIGVVATDAGTRQDIANTVNEVVQAAGRSEWGPEAPRPYLSESGGQTQSSPPSGEKSKDGSYSPDRPLPVDKKTGNAIPEKNADGSTAGPHTQLGKRESSNPKSPGKYTQGREYDGTGRRVKDVDFTDHGRRHPNPHQHSYDPKTGKRGPAEPLGK